MENDRPDESLSLQIFADAGTASMIFRPSRLK
jgi:hypothetical protein